MKVSTLLSNQLSSFNASLGLAMLADISDFLVNRDLFLSKDLGASTI